MFKKLIILIYIILNEQIKIGNSNLEVKDKIIYINKDNHDSSKFDLKYSFYFLTDKKCSDCTYQVSILKSLVDNLKNKGIYTWIVLGNKYIKGLHNDMDKNGTFYIGYGHNSFKYTGSLNSEDIINFFNNIDKSFFNFVKDKSEVQTDIQNSENKNKNSMFVFYGKKDSEEFKKLEFLQIFSKKIKLYVIDNSDEMIRLNLNEPTLINYNDFEEETHNIVFKMEWTQSNLSYFIAYHNYKKFDVLNKERFGGILEQKLNFVILYVQNKDRPKFENFKNAIENLPKNTMYTYLELENTEGGMNNFEIVTILGSLLNIPMVSEELFVVVEFNKMDIKKSRVNVYNEYFSTEEILRYLKKHQGTYSDDYKLEFIEKQNEL